MRYCLSVLSLLEEIKFNWSTGRAWKESYQMLRFKLKERMKDIGNSYSTNMCVYIAALENPLLTL